MVARLPGVPVIEGKAFRERDALALMANLGLDYVLSVHFPYLFPPDLLDLPRIGTLNLHPAMLPYNRGWHTPSWAIMEGTPMGATLHWVNSGVDSGDIAMQRAVSVRPDDTADSLYRRTLEVELELLGEAIPLLREQRLPRVSQTDGGTYHVKTDLAAVRAIDLSESMRVGELIDRLRALTTSVPEESAFFTVRGRRYLVQVQITEQSSNGNVTAE